MNGRMNIRLLMAMAVVIAVLAAAGFFSTLDTSTNAGAELDDMATIADEMGITLQEAVIRYSWNDDFARMVSEIRASSPEELATAEVTGDDSASVYFAGEISASARTLVDAFKGDFPGVKVATQENKGFTEPRRRYFRQTMLFRHRRPTTTQKFL